MPLTTGPVEQTSPGLISQVTLGSLGARAGLGPGDELLAINGKRLRDEIDVRYYGAEPLLQLQVRRDGQPLLVQVERRYEEPLGLAFAEPVFDGIRRCNNRCEFCFVAQMPPGLRPSLYVRDDDYRMSFLFGSYITLTNLTESDWARIDEQHLSPLYVSVHATHAGLRRQLLRNPAAPDVMEQLRRLAGMGIEVHTQIVIQPGVNGGEHLDRSIADLAGLYPAVRSVSVVPLGLTKQHRFGCRLHSDAEAREVVERVTGWQGELRVRLGASFVYLSDEWYLRVGAAVPPLEAYDGLDLTENGVGLVASFRAEGATLRVALGGLDGAILVTGELFGPVLRQAVGGLPVTVVPVANRFFGRSVTVAGLLTAGDVMVALEDRGPGLPVLLPPAMFGGPEGQSLDELWPRDVARALGRPVWVGTTPLGENVAMGGQGV
jgi:putative radical SAM enzyme (TIGR03279 family)